MKKILFKVNAIALLLVLAGCSAASAYSLKAQTADSLTASAQDNLVKKAKEETIKELEAKGLINNNLK